MKSFSGKVAAITGAASGIGRALGLALARRGCALALSDIDAAGLEGTVKRCTALGARVTSSLVDVAQRQAVSRWADRVNAEHGRVNLIFNNAGVSLVAAVENMTYEDLEWIFGVNFWGVVHGTKAFLPHLRAAGEGHVVNISSVFGITAVPHHGAYNATKFAVRGFTEALRMELEMAQAPISATSVMPGGIRTSIAKNARIGVGLDGLPAGDDAGRELFERNCRTTADAAAEKILNAVVRNQRRVLVGADAIAIDLLVRAAPAASQHVVRHVSKRLS